MYNGEYLSYTRVTMSLNTEQRKAIEAARSEAHTAYMNNPSTKPKSRNKGWIGFLLGDIEGGIIGLFVKSEDLKRAERGAEAWQTHSNFIQDIF